MPTNTEQIVIFITASSDNEADKIATILLNQRKAACVNTLHGVKSAFWWKGKIDYTQESLLIIKTSASVLPEVIDLVKKVHGYEIPEIIALPIIGGNGDYLKWLDNEVTK
jgi:periplasmic divalent cation tolerance protein